MTVASHTGEKHKRQRLSIRKAAALLDTDWSHLARVVRGERVSRSLLRRYRALSSGKAAA